MESKKPSTETTKPQPTSAGAVSPRRQRAAIDTIDGANACANVAHFMSEISFIFPISPSSPMAENYDLFVSKKRKNVFGVENKLRQMQSEAGVAGSIHGALVAGNIATTFTASQGLLLMIPNMYKIAGELLPCVIHIAARTIATHALSIFGDHSDLYAVRVTNWAILVGSSVQEAQDLALVAHLATLKARVPFIHSMDGYRISHEVNKINLLDWEGVHELIDQEALANFRKQAMDSEHPDQRGTAQNPDVFFQQREACQPYYDAVPGIVEEVMNAVGRFTGRQNSLFEYYGDQNAEYVVVLMGSAAEVVQEYLDFMTGNNEQAKKLRQELHGGKFGFVNVKLYRPWSTSHFMKTLPSSVKHIAVLDRIKEANSNGEPLYVDVVTTLRQCNKTDISVIGGRYGLSSKDFTPQMVHSVYLNMLASTPKHPFTVGITDDVSNTSLEVQDVDLDTAPSGTRQCVCWGLGSDGTVSANKIAIKIIGKSTDLNTQGFFVYDANKFGCVTTSHLRFGKEYTKAPYLIQHADFVSCAQYTYVYRFRMLDNIRPGGTFLLNTEYVTVDELTKQLPVYFKQTIAKKKLKFYVVDAVKIANECGLRNKTNQILQTAFFKLADVIPMNEAIEHMKQDVESTYGKKGIEVVKKNFEAIEKSLDPKVLIKIEYPEDWANATTGSVRVGEWPEEQKTQFIKEVFDPVISQQGDKIPSSKLDASGRMVSGTYKYAKRGLAPIVPHWNYANCIQCNRCNLSCPHAVIRPFLMTKEEAEELEKRNPQAHTLDSRVKPGMKFKIQITPLDCTGCEVCTTVCPVPETLWMEPINKEMAAGEKENWDYLSTLPHHHGSEVPMDSALTAGFQMPLLEFHSACAGCGEGPILRLLTQLFGQRMLIANATGCTTIWGGTYPNNPYTLHPETKRGPAWANSLYEDNAEFGFGISMTQRNRRDIMEVHVRIVLDNVVDVPPEIVDVLRKWLDHKGDGDASIKIHDEVKNILTSYTSEVEENEHLSFIRDNISDLIKKSVWVVGGDGWAYDIGFGGVDHILQSEEDFNILVIDTEVYSNTGGQRSKATPKGAMAKFAAAGKELSKKDLGLIAMSYGTCYVGSIALGADIEHAYKTLREAEAFKGPSIVIAYAPCIEHGYFEGLKVCMDTQKLAVQTGYWILYRYNPDLADKNHNPFSLDCPAPNKHPKDFLESQSRYKALHQNFPERAEMLHKELMKSLPERRRKYVRMQYNWEYEKPEVQEAIEQGILQVGSDALREIREKVESKTAVSRKPKTAKPVLVMYATETGNSKTAAEMFSSILKENNIDHVLKSIDQVKLNDLKQYELLAVLMSSTGVGDMPSMAEDFYAKLAAAPKSTSCNFKFVLFGLGDPKFRSSYLGAPKDMMKALEDAGATSLMPMGEGSDRDPQGFKTGLAVWMPKAVEKLKEQQAAMSAAAPQEEEEVEEIEKPKKHHHKKRAADLIVGYASASGKTRILAEHVCTQLGTTLNCTISARALNDVTMSELASIGTLICVVSSAGLGEIPENGKQFMDQLSKLQPNSLSNLQVAVFGVGDPSFKQWYLGSAKALMSKFETAGAKFLIAMGQGSERDVEGPYTALHLWLPQLLASVGVEVTGEYRVPKETPVIYCSGTGKSENIARHMHQVMTGNGIKTCLKSTKDLDPKDLVNYDNIVLVMSSCALGEIPPMGEAFYDKLNSMDPGSLKHLRIALFGLGDPSFKEYYMAGPKIMLQAFQQAGASLLLPMGQGSDKDPEGHMTALKTWLPEMLSFVSPLYAVPKKEERKHRKHRKVKFVEQQPLREVTVSFATGTGTSQLAAKRVVDALNASFKEMKQDVRVIGPVAMDTVSVDDLKTMKYFIACLSSVALGDVPAMGAKLYNQISNVAPGSLANLQFAVFGLGDPAFREWYQGGPKKFSKALETAGAWPILPLGLGSAKDAAGYASALERWLPQLAGILRAPAGEEASPTSEPESPKVSEAKPVTGERMTVEKMVQQAIPGVKEAQREEAAAQRDMEIPMFKDEKRQSARAVSQAKPVEEQREAEEQKPSEEPRMPLIRSPKIPEERKPSPRPAGPSETAYPPRSAIATEVAWNSGYNWSDVVLKFRQENPLTETGAPDYNRPIFHNSPKPGSIKLDIKPLAPEQRDPGKVLVDGVFFVTCIDFNIRNFHGYETKNGSTYGSYLIMDEHPTLIDTVKYTFSHQLLENIARLMPIEKLEYLVINHAEPDHSSSTPYIIAACPNVQIVCNEKCKRAMQQIYITEGWKWKIVSDGEVLDIGKRKLRFITVPLVHWPESMWTYDETQKVLYSNDGFGQHLATERLWDDEHSLDEIMAANRDYYGNIVSPYNMQVKKALEKAKDLEIKIIATAHGACWRSYIPQAVAAYKAWSNGEFLPRVLIIYDTMYAATEMLAQALHEGIRSTGADVKLISAKATHITYMASDLLESAAVCLGSSCINGQMLPTIESAVCYLAGFSAYERLGLTFGSYGWQGPVLEDLLNKSADRLNLKRSQPPLICQYTPTSDMLKKCWSAGRDLGAAVIDLVRKQRENKK